MYPVITSWASRDYEARSSQLDLTKINFMFVIHKHLFVICVCDAQISGPKTNFVVVKCKHIIDL